MKWRNIALFILGLLVAINSFAGVDPRQTDALNHIPVTVSGKVVIMTLREAMNYFKVPAVSLAVIENNKLAWTYSTGYLSPSKQQPINNNTLFQAGSLSKPVAALLAIKLCDQNILPLDKDVNPLLKGWEITKPAKYKDMPVTLRELVSMSSGLDTGGYFGYAPGEKLPTLVQLLSGKPPADNPPVKLIYQPGSQYYYSGGGYEVMELLIDSVTQSNFTDLAYKEILSPLAMDRSTFVQPLPAKLTDNAVLATDQDGHPFDYPWRVNPEHAAAGLWTTPTDLAKFTVAIIKAYQGSPHAIISRDLAKQVLTQQTNTPYGLGFAVEGAGKKLHFMKMGQNAGYQGWLVGFPITGQGAVVMTNSDNGRELAQDIIYSLAKTYRWSTDGKLKDAWMLDPGES